jgi:uncharacterized protein (TIGR01244 family)
MTKFIAVAPEFSVAPQIGPEDFAAAAAQGFRTIINNRPDGEAPGQLSSADAEAAAAAAGLIYRAIPVVMPFPSAAIDAFAEALAQTPGPHLAYCRSGTRSITLWSMAQAKAGADPDALVKAAADAGYDLSGARATRAALGAG